MPPLVCGQVNPHRKPNNSVRVPNIFYASPPTFVYRILIAQHESAQLPVPPSQFANFESPFPLQISGPPSHYGKGLGVRLQAQLTDSNPVPLPARGFSKSGSP